MRNREASPLTASPTAPPDRVRRLALALAEAGLAGHVRIGVPRPIDPPRRLDAGKTRLPPTRRAEEGGTPSGTLVPDPLLGLATGTAGGRLVEIAGPRSSGRTALAYRVLAETTARGELAGWVDLPDALDPRFLRRAGAALERTLWVRPPTLVAALRAAEILVHTGFALVVLDLEGEPRAGLARLGPPVWTRLVQRVRAARSTLVLLAGERLAGSFATLGLSTERVRACFERGLFEGLESRAVVVRDRAAPPGGEHDFRVFQRPSAARG